MQFIEELEVKTPDVSMKSRSSESSAQIAEIIIRLAYNEIMKLSLNNIVHLVSCQ